MQYLRQRWRRSDGAILCRKGSVTLRQTNWRPSTHLWPRKPSPSCWPGDDLPPTMPIYQTAAGEDRRHAGDLGEAAAADPDELRRPLQAHDACPTASAAISPVARCCHRHLCTRCRHFVRWFMASTAPRSGRLSGSNTRPPLSLCDRHPAEKAQEEMASVISLAKQPKRGCPLVSFDKRKGYVEIYHGSTPPAGRRGRHHHPTHDGTAAKGDAAAQLDSAFHSTSYGGRFMGSAPP